MKGFAGLAGAGSEFGGSMETTVVFVGLGVGTRVPFDGPAGMDGGVNSTRPVVFTTHAYASGAELARIG